MALSMWFSIASLTASLTAIVLAILGSVLDKDGLFTASYVISFTFGIPLAFVALVSLQG